MPGYMANVFQFSPALPFHSGASVGVYRLLDFSHGLHFCFLSAYG